MKCRQDERMFGFCVSASLDRLKGLVATACTARTGVLQGIMNREQLKEIFDRVLTWPPERQEDFAHVVEFMEQQDRSPLRLTDEQAAEVRRRVANPSADPIPAEHVFRRYRSSDA
jgi:hypothetical protein